MDSISKTIFRFLQYCEKSRNLSSHTLKAYKIDLTQFIRCVGAASEARHIEKKDLQLFHSYLIDNGLNQSSVKRKLACVRAMFHWLEQEDEIELNPFHKFNVQVKLPKRLPRNVHRSDLRKMLHQNQKSISSPSTHQSHLEIPLPRSKRELNDFTSLIALEIMLTTGIRVSELCGITLTDVFLAEKKIKIFGKGSRERFVYLPDNELCKLIKQYLRVRTITQTSESTLLVNSRGGAASTQFIRKLTRDLSQKANTQVHVTPHMLRHSAACELIESGLDIRFVQRLLGHSSISTTEIYTHVTDNALQSKIEGAKVRRRIMK